MAPRSTRSRQSRRTARLDFAGLEIVGALLTPDIVTRLAAFEANDQSEESYEIPAGLKLRDEIARYYRIGEALWSRFEATRGQGAALSERFVLDLLRHCFGFDSIEPQPITRLGEREFPVRHAARGGRVPIVIAPPPADDARRSGVDESLSQFGDSSRRRSATLHPILRSIDQGRAQPPRKRRPTRSFSRSSLPAPAMARSPDTST